MIAGLGQIRTLLENNVVDLRFTRRRSKPGSPPTRRMLCTNSAALLNSTDGKVTLNFRAPIKRLRYDPNTKGIIVTWDVLMQDFRCVSTDSVDLLEIIPANEKFWEFFNETLAGMDVTDKMNYMDQ